jgi:hypothetical protein
MEDSRRKSFKCLYEKYFAVLVRFSGRCEVCGKKEKGRLYGGSALFVVSMERV